MNELDYFAEWWNEYERLNPGRSITEHMAAVAAWTYAVSITQSDRLKKLVAVPATVCDEPILRAALKRLQAHIEAGPPHEELSRASSLCTYLLGAIGDNDNPPNPYYAKIVEDLVSVY